MKTDQVITMSIPWREIQVSLTKLLPTQEKKVTPQPQSIFLSILEKIPLHKISLSYKNINAGDYPYIPTKPKYYPTLKFLKVMMYFFFKSSYLILWVHRWTRLGEENSSSWCEYCHCMLYNIVANVFDLVTKGALFSSLYTFRNARYN